MRYLGTNPTVITEPEQAAARIETWSAFTGPLHGIWAIVPDGQDLPVGTALMKLLPYSGTKAPSAHTEVGWHLHPDAWGHGYATGAGGRLLAHAWSHGLEEVFAVTYPENEASKAVCLRLGMAPQGMTDAYYDISCALFRAERPG
jgi:RimJ/RimL family protein N-acetyltransferase